VTKLSREELISLVVDEYFGKTDVHRLDEVLDTMQPDVTFDIPTHGAHHEGRDTGIRTMFDRLYEAHAAVWHGDFHHVVDVDAQWIASQFTVRNTEHDGSVTEKHNCNFFEVVDGKLSRVWVYMEGPNTLP
jgi:hypothetical protein